MSDSARAHDLPLALHDVDTTLIFCFSRRENSLVFLPALAFSLDDPFVVACWVELRARTACFETSSQDDIVNCAFCAMRRCLMRCKSFALVATWASCGEWRS
jgi:hypothetical protein